jgi:hypothetical protein
MKAPEYGNLFGTGDRFPGGGGGSFGGDGSTVASFVNYANFPEIRTYQDELAKLTTEGANLRMILPPESPKYTDYLLRRSKFVESFKTEIFPEIQKKAIKLAQDNFHQQLLQQIKVTKATIEQWERFPKQVAPRRSELVARLNRVTTVTEEQKLLEDELQVLREFRKVVLKQKLTLKLEIEGVVLPVEPKK